jgi:hypothetical protein
VSVKFEQSQNRTQRQPAEMALASVTPRILMNDAPEGDRSSDDRFTTGELFPKGGKIDPIAANTGQDGTDEKGDRPRRSKAPAERTETEHSDSG